MVHANDDFDEVMVDDYTPPSAADLKEQATSAMMAHQPSADEELAMKDLPSARTDPFAKREGKTLTWTNVNMTLSGKGDEPDRKLLNDVWGEVPMTKTTAIMGPSGAGKTSLLNILAGRAKTGGKLKIDNDVRLNNYSVDPTNIHVRKQIAFVAQDDSLQITATPREAIRFSAKLRLSRDTTDDELDKLTERMLHELGLVSCADTLVGGPLLKGISGGERKRTSVGVELVVRPALVFLDEPTSGLDSFSAVQLCQVLKKVATSGASVLFTIHQPSSEIFNSFDQLILLNKGQVMYQGPVEGVPEYFAERGRPNPTNYNPADWIMNVAQAVPMEDLEKAGFFPKDPRKIGDAFKPEAGHDELGITISRHATSHGTHIMDQRTPGMMTQTAMLFKREVQSVQRNTAAVMARFGLTIFLSLLVGVIFKDVGRSDPTEQINIQSRFGATIMVLLQNMFGTAQPALLAFPDERPVFLREYSTDHYSVVGYFAARFTMEAVITALQVLVSLLVCFWLIGFQANFFLFFIAVYCLAMASTALAVLLGCAVEDPKMGQEMLPILFVPQMLFAGFFVAPALIPVWLRWARFLCTLTYSVRILLVAEFDSCALEPDDLCTRTIENVGADPDETGWNWVVLIVLFVAFRLGALYVLRQKATKFF